MRPFLIKAVLALTVLSFGLLLYGFVVGANDVLYPKGSNSASKQAEAAQKKTDALQLVSLGDSLTRGVGDQAGIGYIGRIRSSLEKDYDQKTALSNLAVSGAKMPDLIEQLGDTGVQYSVGQADAILLTIGGNDLFPGWESLGSTDLTTYRPDEATFQANAKTILTKLREMNPDSPIFWIGLYNPFEDVPQLTGSSTVVADWNALLGKTALDYKNVYVVPVFDLFQSRGSELLYSDHFHPNEKGYTLVANRVLQNLISQLGIEKEEAGS